MKVYKLTDKRNQTYNNTQWGPGVTHTATGEGKDLCTNAVIHFYRTPAIAVLANPIHANFDECNLWEAEVNEGDIVAEDALNGGARSLTTIRQIEAPVITMEQRIKWGILAVEEVYHAKKWNKWAEDWLSGKDRTEDSARAAYAAASDSARAACAAAHAAGAAYAAYAAYATCAAAHAAAAGAAAGEKLDLVGLAQKILKGDA